MNVLEQLSQWVIKKPLILLRFDEAFTGRLMESRRGFERFTFARPHEALDEMKLPTLCFAEMNDGNSTTCHVGVIESKAAVTTFDSRLTVTKLQDVNLDSFKSLSSKITSRQFRNALRVKLASGSFPLLLSPKLSSHIIERLWADKANKRALETTARYLPRFRSVSNPEWGQLDAIQTAMAVFGIGKGAIPERITVRKDSASTLRDIGEHFLEDNVIAKDASVVPGFSLIEKDLTGRAVFQKGDERLEVYTANRGPLEEMLGVDLIYLNDTVGSVVMLQYKMLKEERTRDTGGSDWVFRPDGQFEAERSRMRLPPINVRTDDYRLHPSPFYFKFVKRKGMDDSHQSFVITHEHLNQLLRSRQAKGPKGGLRVSYKVLDGVYLRESDLIGLIRSGYIGTHRVETAALGPIISEVSKGDRALVFAWQKRIRQTGQHS